MGLEKDITAAADTAAVIEVTNAKYLDWILWSYDDTPTGGKLTVDWDGTTLLEVDITQGGPGHISWPSPSGVPMLDDAGTLTITLAAAGAAVTGKVNALVRT